MNPISTGPVAGVAGRVTDGAAPAVRWTTPPLARPAANPPPPFTAPDASSAPDDASPEPEPSLVPCRSMPPDVAARARASGRTVDPHALRARVRVSAIAEGAAATRRRRERGERGIEAMPR